MNNSRTTQSALHNLCKLARIKYTIDPATAPRIIQIQRTGGHRKIEMASGISEFHVDISRFGSTITKRRRAKLILEILAVELSCVEAGETLVTNGVVERTATGAYVLKGNSYAIAS